MKWTGWGLVLCGITLIIWGCIQWQTHNWRDAFYSVFWGGFIFWGGYKGLSID